MVHAGAEIMMLESEGITEDLPAEEWRTDIIEELNKRSRDTWLPIKQTHTFV